MKARSPEAAAIDFDLRAALRVWGHVLSRPEPGRLICGVGKRDVGADAGPPRLVAWARPGDPRPRDPMGSTVTGLFDQHLIMDGPDADELAVGDLVAFGVSHPCTTFDKWRELLILDDKGVVVQTIETQF